MNFTKTLFPVSAEFAGGATKHEERKLIVNGVKVLK